MQSPGSLIATEGRWLTGSEVDDVQTLLQSTWSGSGLQSVSSDFTAPFHSGETAVATVRILHFYAQMCMFLCYTQVVNLYAQVLFSPVRKHWLTVYGGQKSVCRFGITGDTAHSTSAGWQVRKSHIQQDVYAADKVQ